MTDVMKYSVEAFAERMLLEGDLQGNRIVLQLLNQRADLLEALKGMKDVFCNPESGEIDKRLAVQDMNIAITKAESVE